MISLFELQREVGEWSRRNFGDQPSYRPLLGVGEEVGELMHAHLKGEQGIRHSPDEIKKMKEDAVGDILIYLADYCEREKLTMQGCADSTWYLVKRRDWEKNKMNADKVDNA